MHLHFEKWTRDPSAFFKTSQPVSRDLRHKSIDQLYVVLKDLTQNQEINQICLRFGFLLFNSWKAESCKRLGRHMKDELVRVIAQSGLVRDSSVEIKEFSAKWASAGARYSQLALELGGLGSLMLLPEDITPYE